MLSFEKDCVEGLRRPTKDLYVMLSERAESIAVGEVGC
jgi:hypothetical protein